MGGIWVTLRTYSHGVGGCHQEERFAACGCKKASLARGLHVGGALGPSSDQRSALAKKRGLQPGRQGFPALDKCAQLPGVRSAGSGAHHSTSLPLTPTLIHCHSPGCRRRHPEGVTRTLRARPAPAGGDVGPPRTRWPPAGLSPGWCAARTRLCDESPASSGAVSEWKHYHNLITFQKRSLRNPSPQPQCQPRRSQG